MMISRRTVFVPFLLLCSALAALPHRALASGADETFDSAVFLLKQCLTASPDGRHNLLLRALRQLRDPQLEPLFSEKVQSESPTLKIHGLLGLAEAQKDRKLDLVRIAAIENPIVQAEVISAAMDSDLVSDEQARQLLNWPGLEVGVKVVVAAPLVKKKQLPDPTFLRDAAKKSDNLGRATLCHLMLLQLGDPGELDHLKALDKSTDPKRDTVREMALQTALRYEFDRVAPWAMAVATEPGVSSRLGLLALRAALRFGAPGAADLWKRQYASNDDPSDRTRLALIVLQLSPWMEASVYEPLMSNSDPLIRKIGVVGKAVVAKQNIAPAIVDLVQLNHPVASNWAMMYAKDYATDADAQTILLAIILATDSGPARNHAQRLDDAVSATQILSEKPTLEAGKLLRSVLVDPKTSNDMAKAILVGMMRSDTATPDKLLENLPTFDDPATNNVALLLLAKHGRKLTPDQLNDLSLAVRGGGSLLPTLRVQAAWTYLKITNKTREALAEVLGG
ncbi:MAG: hypothetical protein K8S99_08165 [Planctomycetes bacterium]|nr:hypothetical protein [Planctomycetota bacterium]